MDKEKKTQVIEEYAINEKDVGSVQVQVAVLTERIKELTEHLKANRKDHSSRRGLIAMVNRRRKLLDYLSGKSHDEYRELIAKLKLRR